VFQTKYVRKEHIHPVVHFDNLLRDNMFHINHDLVNRVTAGTFHRIIGSEGSEDVQPGRI
jgi:hypothetical protein